MAIEILKNNYYSNVFSRYKKLKCFFPIIGAVLEGKQQGLVLTNSNHNPEAFFVIHKFGFAQHFEFTSVAKFNHTIFNLLTAKNQTATIFSFPEKIRLYNSTPLFSKMLHKSCKKYIARSKRVSMRITDYTYQADTHSAFEISKISAKDIQNINDSLKLNIDHRFWNSAEEVIRDGLGYILKLKSTDEICSVCYAAAVSNNIAEIDICTAKKHQKKGYALAVANTFVNDITAKAMIPNWDCYTNNTASLVLAAKLNFKPRFEYDFYTVNLYEDS